MNRAEDIKVRVNLREYVERDLGRPEEFSHSYHKWRCPFHTERTASFVVYDDHWTCYGACDETGDIFSYVQHRLNCDFKDALKIVGEGVNLNAPPVVTKSEPKPRKILELKDVAGWELQRDRVLPYLIDERKLTTQVLEINHIGAEVHSHTYITSEGTPISTRCNRVSLPYVFGERVLSLNWRRDDASVNAFLKDQPKGLFEAVRCDLAEKGQCPLQEIVDNQVRQALFGRHYDKPTWAQYAVFGCDQICELRDGKLHYKEIGAAIFSEGEISSMAAQSLRYISLGCKSSQKLDLRRCTQNIRNKYIVVENDRRKNAKGVWEHPGLDHAVRLYDQLGGAGSGVKLLRLPEDVKDLDDLLIVGELDNFLATSCIGLEPQ